MNYTVKESLVLLQNNTYRLSIEQNCGGTSSSSIYDDSLPEAVWLPGLG